jgi:hypothetical protein
MYLLIDFEKEIVDLDSLSKAELETFFGFDSAADPVLDFFTLILEAFLTAFFLKLTCLALLPGLLLFDISILLPFYSIDVTGAALSI